GMACTEGGGAYCCCGAKKGNSGSGAAAAEEVKAIAPMVIAPKAAATSRALSLAELNIVVPCYLRPCAPVPGASLGTAIQMNRFGTFARNRQNGFVGL